MLRFLEKTRSERRLPAHSLSDNIVLFKPLLNIIMKVKGKFKVHLVIWPPYLPMVPALLSSLSLSIFVIVVVLVVIFVVVSSADFPLFRDVNGHEVAPGGVKLLGPASMQKVFKMKHSLT